MAYVRLGAREILYLTGLLVVVVLVAAAMIQPTRGGSGTSASESPVVVPSDQVDAHGGEPEPPGATAVDATRSFFPTVRDGWRDTATFAWQVDPEVVAWSGMARIVGPDGDVLTRRRLGENPESFTWSGRHARQPVPAGDYRVVVGLHLTTSNPLEERIIRDRLTFPVRVATRTVERTTTTVIRPAEHPAVAVTPRGNCFSRMEVPGSLLLNCHPVGQVSAVLTVAVPDGATVESATHQGRILCCAPGNVRTSWTQPDERTLRLGIRVTGDRRYRLWSMRIVYTYEERA